LAHAEKVHIVGIADDGLEGLTQRSRNILRQADVLIGEPHCLALVGDGGKDRIALGADLDETVRQIEALSKKKIVVLAGGDPLFYGFARYLCDKLGKDRFEVVPHVSTMQIAFARVKESWEEAFLTNLATHDVESVLEQIRSAEKVGLFTTEAIPPKAVAQTLLDRQIDYFGAYVCENLGSPDERVTRAELAEIAAHDFGPLNVMILVRKPHVPDRPSESIGRRLFGNPDEAFLQSRPKRGLLTPAEIRAMALAEMDLGPASVVWDIGAGSGSVAIEAAQIAGAGTVYAIEMDPDDHQLIVENAKRFRVANLIPVLGRAPEAWRDLPDPDAIFVGGSGRGISRLVEAAYERLRVGGRLVATMASIDNIADTHRQLHRCCPVVKVWMLHFARGTCQMDRVRFESLNPTFMVSVVKPA
jgi:precorrin-6Y C5,15-methyltransferase (decarboxylating)